MPKLQKNTWDRFSGLLIGLALVGFLVFPLFTAVKWAIGASSLADTRSLIAVEKINTSITPLDAFNEPILSITFDDGWESIYSNGLPILHEYNLPTTQYLLASTFDDKLYISKAQAQHMYELGHEIGSHSFSHADLTLVDNTSEYNTELNNSKATIEDVIGGSVDHFASPYGAHSQQSVNEISKIYISHRNTDADLSELDSSDINTASNYNVDNINAFTIRSSTTSDEISNLIKYSIAHNAWVVLVYHQIELPGTELEEYSITTDTLRNHLSIIKSSGIKVAPLGRVADEIR